MCSGPTPTSCSVCTYVRCSGQCGLVLLGPSFSESDPKRKSALGHPRQPHALALTFAPGKERQIVAPRIGTPAIERKSCLHGRSRLVHLAEPRENSRETEMRGGVISVCLKTPAQPSCCFGVGIERHLGESDPYEPPVGMRVTRRKAKRLNNVSFGFRAATKKILGIPDKTMSGG